MSPSLDLAWKQNSTTKDRKVWKLLLITRQVLNDWWHSFQIPGSWGWEHSQLQLFLQPQTPLGLVGLASMSKWWSTTKFQTPHSLTHARAGRSGACDSADSWRIRTHRLWLSWNWGFASRIHMPVLCVLCKAETRPCMRSSDVEAQRTRGVWQLLLFSECVHVQPSLQLGLRQIDGRSKPSLRWNSLTKLNVRCGSTSIYEKPR